MFGYRTAAPSGRHVGQKRGIINMEFYQLAKMRCTTRGFADQPIPKADLEYILSTGRVAPSACNQQPQRIIVIQKPENIQQVQKAYETFGSRCILIVCRDTRGELIRPYDQKCSGDLDIGIICDHMMLAAREKNIGSVMVGLFDPRIIRKEFGVPEYIEPTALIILGYPDSDFLDSERHQTQRKPLVDTVMYEYYHENNS
jgi:nitroreductase